MQTETIAAIPPHLRKLRLRRREASEYLLVVHGVRLSTQRLSHMASQAENGPRYPEIRSLADVHTHRARCMGGWPHGPPRVEHARSTGRIKGTPEREQPGADLRTAKPRWQPFCSLSGHWF